MCSTVYTTSDIPRDKYWKKIISTPDSVQLLTLLGNWMLYFISETKVFWCFSTFRILSIAIYFLTEEIQREDGNIKNAMM